MKLRKLSILALASMTALALYGCGGGDTASADNNGGAEGDQIEINFFHRWPNDPKNAMFKELIA